MSSIFLNLLFMKMKSGLLSLEYATDQSNASEL
jgi:ssDNA-specific exonuclease RecJ